MLLVFIAIFKLTDRNLLCIKGEEKWDQIGCINGSAGFCEMLFLVGKKKSFGLWERSIDVVSDARLWWGFVNLIHPTQLCLTLGWNTGYWIRSQVCPELLLFMSCWNLMGLSSANLKQTGKQIRHSSCSALGEGAWGETRDTVLGFVWISIRPTWQQMSKDNCLNKTEKKGKMVSK